MNSFVYIIYDKVANQYLPTFEVNNDQVALREFDRIFAQNKDLVREDYELLCISKLHKIYHDDGAELLVDIIDPDCRKIKTNKE